MKALSRKIQKSLSALIWSGDPIKIEVKDKKLQFYSLPKKEKENALENIDVLLDWVISEYQYLDLKVLPFSEVHTIRYLLDDIEHYLLNRKFSKEDMEKIESINFI